METWKFGGAPEVEARAAALGGDEAGRCAAITKSTKNHEGTQRLPEWGNRRFRRTQRTQRRQRGTETGGVLAHAGRTMEVWKVGSLEEPRRLKPEPPPLAAMKPDVARLSQSPQRTTKTHKEGNTGGGGPCVRARRTSGLGPMGHGGLRTPRFGSWCARGAHDLAPGDAGDSRDTGAPLRGVKQPFYRAASAAVLEVLYVL